MMPSFWRLSSIAAVACVMLCCAPAPGQWVYRLNGPVVPLRAEISNLCKARRAFHQAVVMPDVGYRAYPVGPPAMYSAFRHYHFPPIDRLPMDGLLDGAVPHPPALELNPPRELK